ncbi:MAG: polysaccharide biosynthesis protein [Nitrospirae bacterium]|nr:polysaccharide biosynthesis protein [Nitrospirota bacterium]
MAKPKFNGRLLLALLHDLAAIVFAWFLAFLLRFNFDLDADDLAEMLAGMAWVLPIQAAISWRLSLYQRIWRFASLDDLWRIVLSAMLGAMTCSLVFALLQMHGPVPRSVLVMYPMLLIMVMGGSRLAYRIWQEHRIGALLHLETKPVLLVGAGEAADMLMRELARSRSKWHVVGVLDDDPGKHGRQLHGVTVLGPIAEVTQWAECKRVSDVILAVPSASHALRRQVVERCTEAGLNVLTVPSLEDLMHGRVTVAAIRKFKLDDLLGRDPVQLDNDGLHTLLTGQTILVTGAGGSIGSEICRQVTHFRPERLLLFEQGEHALYQIEQELRSTFPELAITCVIGDVKDVVRMGEVMRRYRPKVVFHAAAYKHVPLMEEENALQALRNNVLGTAVTAWAALESGVGKFVFVSTDKAVNPTNVMGASKRLAEMVCQVIGAPGTRFVSVRFGNVLGSSGSVIPKFQKQIEAGGPITVTHPEITRYFMSIPEAAQLVLQAGFMGQGGEIFVLDMGEPVKIANLARLMIKLSGHTETAIRIVYTGLRPGEKLYEELLADAETTLSTPHPKLRVAKAREADPASVEAILQWIEGTAVASDEMVRARIKDWIPEYCPTGTPTALIPSPLHSASNLQTMPATGNGICNKVTPGAGNQTAPDAFIPQLVQNHLSPSATPPAPPR